MKIRTSFVSNSSSSSFICIGVQTTIDKPRGYDHCCDNVIGRMIGRSDTDSCDVDSIPLSELTSIIDDVKSMCSQIDINEDKIKLYFGTEYN